MFVSKLGDLMATKGLNQSELSRATGLTHSTIRKFLKGQFDRLDGETVDALMRYFQLSSLSQLVEFVPSSPSLETLKVHQQPWKSTRSTRAKKRIGNAPIAAAAP